MPESSPSAVELFLFISKNESSSVVVVEFNVVCVSTSRLDILIPVDPLFSAKATSKSPDVVSPSGDTARKITLSCP